LKCGHSFCAECISNWYNQGNNSCPICRNKIDESEPQNRKEYDHNPELEFRLNRVHFYYPYYSPQINTDPHYNGSYANTIVSLDPSRISSSSSSFGGGISFGGGGGSW